MDYIAQPKDYWIAQGALTITLNALGNPNRIQGSVASGAAILCYIDNVEGLGYDNGHRFKTWQLTISPTFFNSNTAKYVYVAIPRTTTIGTQAVVVFPSEKLDIYGVNAEDVQVGNTDYYYIWLQGIITATDGTNNRTWGQAIDAGRKGTDEDLYDDTESEWYQYSKVSETVTFLKKITMKAGSWFQNIFLGDSAHELIGVANGATAEDYIDSETLVATPSYIHANYLNKKNEDTAEKEIGFLKGIWIKTKNLFGFDEDGNIKANDIDAAGDVDILGSLNVNGNTTIDGILSALAKVLSNHIESDNWSGDGAFDTGFQIKKATDGITSLVVDNLFVRMKAIFNELEIRKISYAGGNIIFSHAGSHVIAVKAMYNHIEARVEGHTLYISGAANVGAHSIYTEGGSVSNHVLTPVGGEVLAAYRCYLMADDGTTATENWWRVDDQARCQTFNIKEGVYQNVSNQFYWRRVIATGQEVLEDGKTYDYVDLSISDCIQGSTVPQAGDQLVQMGNRTDADRQGFITIEVSGESAPAFKVYKGVNSYTLDGKRKICLSPKLSEIRAQKFITETEYDICMMPKQRSEEWHEGMECYYYDLVQYNGSSWLCIYPESGIGGVMFTTEEPTPLAQYWRYYAKAGKDGSDGKSFNILGSYDTEAALIATHPTGEVGDAYIVAGFLYVWDEVNNEWHNSGKIQGDPGRGISYATITYGVSSSATTLPSTWVASPSDLVIGQGDYLYTRTILTYDDNTTSSPAYSITRFGTDGSYKSIAFCRTNQDIRNENLTGGDISNPVPNSISVGGETITFYDGIPAGEATVWAASNLFYGDGRQAGWTTAKKMTDTATFDVEFSPNTTKPANPSDTVSERNAQGWYDPERNPTYDFTTSIWRAERHCKNGVWSAWAIENIKGEKGDKGDSALVTDLTNQMDSVAMTSDGKVAAAETLTTTIKQYYGTTLQTLTDITWGTLPTGITATKNVATGLVTFAVAKDAQFTNDKAEITLTATSAKGSQDVVFTIQGFRAGADGEDAVIYQIVPSENTIKKSKTGAYTPTMLSCKITKRVGNNPSEDYVGNEVSLKYQIDNGSEQTYYNPLSVAVLQPSEGITFKLYHGSTLIDVETIAVAEDGQDGIGQATCYFDYDIITVHTDADGKVTEAVDVTIPFKMYLGLTELVLSEASIEEGGTTHYASLAQSTLFDKSSSVTGHTVNVVGGRVEEHSLKLNGTDYNVSWAAVRVQIPVGAVLDEHNIMLSAVAHDSSLNDYIGYDSLVIQGSTQGATGEAAYNTATVQLYQRYAPTLANPLPALPNGVLVYTFADGTLVEKVSGTGFNGWSREMPQADKTKKLFITMATARSKSASDEIAANEWAEAVEYVADGEDAAPTINSAPIIIYKRSASQPGNSDRPANGVTYTFATGALSGTLNGWSKTIPADDGNPCWTRQATALGTDTTDTINASEWSGDSNGKAVKFVEDGTNGKSVKLDGKAKTTSALDPDYASHYSTEGDTVLIIGGYDAIDVYESGSWEGYSVDEGSCYLCEDDKHLYHWNGEEWEDYGQFNGEDGDDGEDAINVIVSPASLIVNQDLNNPSNLSNLNRTFVVTVNKGGVAQTVNSIGFESESAQSSYKLSFLRGDGTEGGSGTITGNVLTLKAIAQYTQNDKQYYYDTAYADLTINYGSNKTINNIRVNVYANLLGTWKETVEADTKSSIAQSTWFDLDANGNIVESQRLGNFIQSSKENTARLEESNYFNLYTGANPSFPVSFSLTAADITKYGTSYRLSLSVSSANENLTIQVKRGSTVVKTYQNVNDVLEDALTLSVAGDYTITCNKTATIIGIGIYSTSKDKYTEVSQTVYGITQTISGPNGLNQRISTAESNISTIRGEVESPNLLDFSEWYNTGEEAVNISSNDYEITCEPSQEEDDVDVYSQLFYLEPGIYTFSAFFLDSEQVSGTPNEVYVYINNEPFSPGDTTESLGQPNLNETSEYEGPYYRYYGTFSLNAKKYVRMNVYRSGEAVDFLMPMLHAGNTTSAAVLLPYNPNLKTASESSMRQTASTMSFNVQNSIEGKLFNTGIDIQGNHRAIKLQADKVKFTNSAGTVDNKIWIDANTGTLHAEDGEFAGTVRANILYKRIVTVPVQVHVDPETKRISPSVLLTCCGGYLPNTLILTCEQFGSQDDTMYVELPKASSWLGHEIEIYVEKHHSFDEHYASGQKTPYVHIWAKNDDANREDYGFCDVIGREYATILSSETVYQSYYYSRKVWHVKLMAQQMDDHYYWVVMEYDDVVSIYDAQI